MYICVCMYGERCSVCCVCMRFIHVTYIQIETQCMDVFMCECMQGVCMHRHAVRLVEDSMHDNVYDMYICMYMHRSSVHARAYCQSGRQTENYKKKTAKYKTKHKQHKQKTENYKTKHKTNWEL